MGLLATYKPSNIDNFYHEATILVVPRTMAPIFFQSLIYFPFILWNYIGAVPQKWESWEVKGKWCVNVNVNIVGVCLWAMHIKNSWANFARSRSFFSKYFFCRELYTKEGWEMLNFALLFCKYSILWYYHNSVQFLHRCEFSCKLCIETSCPWYTVLWTYFLYCGLIN